ncbi:hypothetical protein DUI87_27397 [Hirundo rustica rustica]|uniref:Uncharacterized protein n=1 Tax=Hirundo rustica rustica TaxID=333673 RepID=A0A3M0J3Z1_HIRRU|nr:hypothetical protein DUI87_27397 [Hirundo rustica rustica]
MEQVHPHIPAHFASKKHQDIACVLVLKTLANRLSQPPLPLLFHALAHKQQVHLHPGPPAQPQARAGVFPETSSVTAMFAAPRPLQLQEHLRTSPMDAHLATLGLAGQGRAGQGPALHDPAASLPARPCCLLQVLPGLLGLGKEWHSSNVVLLVTSPCWQLQGSPLCDITVLAAPMFQALETLHGKRPEPHPVIKRTGH